jgi:hypothetical protein
MPLEKNIDKPVTTLALYQVHAPCANGIVLTNACQARSEWPRWRRASEKMEWDDRNPVNTASSMKIIPSTRGNGLPIELQDSIS